jgi:acyl-homoserine lactone acylase PvdQ
VLAHLLLFKAFLKRYGRHHWKTWKVAGAAIAMGMISKYNWQRTAVTCSTLGLARKVDAENKSIRYKGVPQGPKPGSSRPGELNHFFGQTHTEENRALISEAGKDRFWWLNTETGETTTSKVCPGEGWIRKRLPTGKQKNPNPDKGKSHMGPKNHKSRAIYIRHVDWEGEKFYPSANQAAKEYGLLNCKLLATAHGTRKHHKGFIARFA